METKTPKLDAFCQRVPWAKSPEWVANLWGLSLEMAEEFVGGSSVAAQRAAQESEQTYRCAFCGEIDVATHDCRETPSA